MKLAWKEAIEQRTPEALKVLDDALAGKLRGYRYAAARDVLTWTDPDRNKQKHELPGGGVVWHITIPRVETDGNGRPLNRPSAAPPAHALPPGRSDD